MGKSFLTYCEKERHLIKLLRADVPLGTGKWGMPLILKTKIDLSEIHMISFDEARDHVKNPHLHTVHFFIDDYRQEIVYNSPDRYYGFLAKFQYVLTPDYSLYTDMPLPIQMHNIFKSRWCGVKWQDLGISVIPTISWSDDKSYEFCFEGIEKGTTIAISSVGIGKGNHSKELKLFLNGYYMMVDKISPEKILWYGPKISSISDSRIVYHGYDRYEYANSKYYNQISNSQYELAFEKANS